jgi:hypothetical protein
VFQVEPKPEKSGIPLAVIAVLLFLGVVLAVAWRWIVFVLVLLAFGAGFWLAWH